MATTTSTIPFIPSFPLDPQLARLIGSNHCSPHPASSSPSLCTNPSKRALEHESVRLVKRRSNDSFSESPSSIATLSDGEIKENLLDMDAPLDFETDLPLLEFPPGHLFADDDGDDIAALRGVSPTDMITSPSESDISEAPQLFTSAPFPLAVTATVTATTATATVTPAATTPTPTPTTATATATATATTATTAHSSPATTTPTMERTTETRKKGNKEAPRVVVVRRSSLQAQQHQQRQRRRRQSMSAEAEDEESVVLPVAPPLTSREKELVGEGVKLIDMVRREGPAFYHNFLLQLDAFKYEQITAAQLVANVRRSVTGIRSSNAILRAFEKFVPTKLR